MKMTINIKKILITALGVLCCLLAGVALIFAPTFKMTAKASAATTTDMYCDGASIRLADDGKSGIRFHVRVTANEDGSVSLNGTQYDKAGFEALTKGILVIPTDKLSDEEELTVEGATTAYVSGAKAANPSDLVWTLRFDESWFYEATAYVYNIPESSYDREFSFRGYYVNADGDYIYTADTDSRSLSYVAICVKNDDIEAKNAAETDADEATTPENVGYQDNKLDTLNSFLPIDITDNFTNIDTFLYRVGNQNSVALTSLFSFSGADVSIYDIMDIQATSDSVTMDLSDDNKSAQFSGTGIVTLTVGKAYCEEKCLLKLEVVDAKNLTNATGTTTGGNFVLLNDVNASDYVYYWNCQLYGNGFTYSLNGAPTNYSSSHGHGVIITKNTTLDNLQIVGDIYYEYGAYTTNNDYNAAIDVLGDTVIQNCYISGCSAPISARANATIKNTTLYGGAVGNLIIKGGTVTLENVTTANYNDGRDLVGMGVVIHSDAAEDSKLVLNGTLTQYNFIEKSVVPSNSYAKNLHNAMFADSCSGYHFTDDTDTYVNTGIISLTTTFDVSDITDNANTGYTGQSVSASGVSGYVYTQPNTVGSVDNNYSKEDDSHVATEQGAVPPSYAFDYTTKNYQAKADDSNDYCYEDGGVVYISMDDGDSFDWDTSILTVTKGTETLDYTVAMNGTDYTGKSICFNTAGDYEVEYTYTDENNYKLVDGEATNYSEIYTKTVKISVAVIEATTKHAEFTMGSSNAATEKITVDNDTYISATGVAADNSTWTYMTIGDQKIYYPIIAAKLTSTKGSSTYAYFPIFENAVTITDYADNGTGDAFTYDSSTTTLPSTLTAVKGIYKAASDVPYWYNLTNSNLTQSGASQIFKWASSSDAPSDLETYNSVLCYKSPEVSANRVAYITLVQYSYTDATNTTYYYYVGYTLEAFTYQNCVTADTLVTLADGSQVRVDLLTGNEQLLVWNLETGAFDSAPIMFVDSEEEAKYEIIHLYFSDGTDVKVISEHGFWDYDLNKYIYLDENAAQYIGHTFAKQNGDDLEKVQLTNVVIERKVTTAWSPVTEKHLCYFVNGMLSMPGGVGGLFNIFEVDAETMAYDYESIQKDIETYGLFTYEELNAIVELPESMFNEAGGMYLKISIGKGNMTMDELIAMINRYKHYYINN